MKKQLIYGFLIGLVVGSSVMGLALSSPSEAECFETTRQITPSAFAVSEDGKTWDTVWTYCKP